jgi:hypothetical protein
MKSIKVTVRTPNVSTKIRTGYRSHVVAFGLLFSLQFVGCDLNTHLITIEFAHFHSL